MEDSFTVLVVVTHGDGIPVFVTSLRYATEHAAEIAAKFLVRYSPGTAVKLFADIKAKPDD